ncbi:MAG TPA: glycosyl transferase family 1, partial [Candidatus Methanomethylia archaeon]|nr:glycosyl transferase family 1 [Candidatus Methanomethylicia archaeon]
MKVLIVHNSLNPCGGAERVSLHTIKALMEAGHNVALGTVEKTNWAKVFGVMGIRLPSIPKEYFLVFRQMKSFSIYQRTLAVLHVMRFSIKKEFDLMINTHGDVMLLP